MTRQYYRVNWADGMLIRTKDFDQLSDYIESRDNFIHALIYGDKLNYGLINPDRETPALSLRLINEELVLERLSAVFGTGHYVHFDQTHYPVSFSLFSLDQKDDDYVVSVVLDPESWMAFGDADPAEFPPRLPWKNYAIRLICTGIREYKPGQIPDYSLPVGYLRKNKGAYSLENSYIPPCLAVNAHPVLFAKFKQYHDDLYNLYQYALLCSRIARNSRLRSEINEAAESLQFISERLTDFISEQIDRYALNGNAEQPWEWYLVFKRLARNLYNSFNSIKAMEAHEAKILISQFTGVKPDDLTGQIQGLLKDNFEQSFINTSIEKIDQFMQTLLNVFRKLKELPEYRNRIYTNFEVGGIQKEETTEPLAPKTDFQLPFKV